MDNITIVFLTIFNKMVILILVSYIWKIENISKEDDVLLINIIIHNCQILNFIIKYYYKHNLNQIDINVYDIYKCL